MTLQQFKVIYRDGRTQIVRADSWEVHGPWFVFSAGGKDTLHIAADNVESLGDTQIANDPKIQVANTPKIQREKWGPEDWRSLFITFVGGVGSIAVGAGLLGLALEAARTGKPSNNITTWTVLVIDPLTALILFIIGIYRLYKRVAGPKDGLMVFYFALVIMFAALTWIGVAAGIK